MVLHLLLPLINSINDIKIAVFSLEAMCLGKCRFLSVVSLIFTIDVDIDTISFV